MKRSPLVAALVLGAVACADAPEHRDAPAPARSDAEVAQAAPQAAREKLLVDSVPSDAAVRVDGVLRGTTPVEIDDVSIGTHRVVVSRPGSWREEEVLVGPGKTAVVVVTAWKPGAPPLEARAPRAESHALDLHDLAARLEEAVARRDRRLLDPLVLDRDEVAFALGGSDSAALQRALADRVARDWKALLRQPGLERARNVSVSAGETRLLKISRQAHGAVEVALDATLSYESDGQTFSIPVGPFVRVRGGWKLLDLLPSRRWN